MRKIVAVSMRAQHDTVVGNRILEGFREWNDLGYDIVASDGGSSSQLRHAAEDLGVEVLDRPAPDIGYGVKQSIGRAKEKSADVIIYTESDKSGKYGFQSKAEECIKPIQDGEADLVMIGRTDRSRETYPKFQIQIEKVINHFYDRATTELYGQNIGDVTYGPRAFKPEIAEYFLNTSLVNWATHFEPLLRIAHDKKRIKTSEVEMEFLDPEEHSDPKNVAFRIEQTLDIVQPVLVHVRQNARPEKTLDYLEDYTKNLWETTALARKLA